MMRYLLLSVLVVCVIGVMIPSVFGQQDLFGWQKQEATPLSEAYATLKNSIMIFFYGGSPIIPTGIVLAIIGAIIVGIIVYIRRKRKRKS